MSTKSRTSHLVDPELTPLLELLPGFTLSVDVLPAIRDGLNAQAAALGWSEIAPVEKLIEGPEGPITIFWYDPTPAATNRPAILHIHGGGMVMGSARHMGRVPSALAASLGLPVASVEYRLAPEYGFPAPQEDCYAALVWLGSSAEGLGINPRRLAVTGESAGGGLAAAVAQMARDRSGPALVAQLLSYPMLDYRVGGPTDPWGNRHTGEFVWSRDNNQFGWHALRGDYQADDARKGWFSPSIAKDLAGLPPAWMGIGSLDLFVDENLDYARRLIDAGVPVELHAYPGAVHGFDMMSEAWVTKAFSRDLVDAARRLIGPI